MASRPMIKAQGQWDWSQLRPAAPLCFYPAGIVYCLAYDLLLDGRLYDLGSVLGWAVLVLTPWVVAAILFERSVQPGETRRQLLLRAAVMALAAYGLSGFASLWLGQGVERAFYMRLPLVATALLLAAMYPLKPLAAKAADRPEPGDEALPVEASEVLYAAGAGNYVELHCGSRVALWRQTLRDAEHVLRPAGFVRVHRSYLVAHRAIASVQKSRKGPVEIALVNGQRLPVSTSYAASVARAVA